MEEEKKDSDCIYIYSEKDDSLTAGNDYDSQDSGSYDDADHDYGIHDSGPYDDADHDHHPDPDPDSSATNFSQYSEEDIRNSKKETSDNNNRNGGVSVFGLLLKTMFNPVEGWKSIRRHKITPEEAQKECFYPLLALYSLSKFAILAYSARADLSEVVVDAVTSFVSFFFGYFLIVMLLRHVLPKQVAEEFDTDFGKTLVVISLSSLCLFFILTELLPMLWAVLIFLPLWTVYMICRSTKFFKIPEDRQIMTVGLMNLIIIGMPTLLEWVFSEILPN